MDIYIDILREIHVQHLDIYMWIWDIYMPSIIPQPLATDPSQGRAKIAAIYVKVFVINDDNLSSSPAGGANMGPCAPLALVHERRTPTIGAARLPTGSANGSGVLAKQSMSASTNNQCQLHQNNQCQLQQHCVQLCPGVHSEHSLMDTRVGNISILKWTPQREAGAQTHILSFSMKLAR